MFFLVRYCWVERCVIYRCRVCNCDIRAIFLDEHPPSKWSVSANVPISCAIGVPAPASIKLLGGCACSQLLRDWSTRPSLQSIYGVLLQPWRDRDNMRIPSLVQFVPPSRGQHLFFLRLKDTRLSTLSNGNSGTKVKSLFWVVLTLFRF